jgi:hypothetical protein
MKPALIRVVILLSLLTTAHALEPEPDWANRFSEVKRQELAKFTAPVIGKNITIVRRIGGELTGRLEIISSNSVAISGKRFEMREMTDETCDLLFADVYATRRARAAVIAERDAYRRAQDEQQRVLQAEAQLALQRSQEARAIPSSPVPPQAQPATPTPTRPPQDNGSPGSSVVGVVVVVVVVLILLSSLRPKRCDICGLPFRRSFYTWNIQGAKKRVCPKCNQGLERHKSKQGLDNLFKGRR